MPRHNDYRLAGVIGSLAGATNRPTARDTVIAGEIPGHISAGGILIRREPIRIIDIKDGASKTAMVGDEPAECRTAQGDRAARGQT